MGAPGPFRGPRVRGAASVWFALASTVPILLLTYLITRSGVLNRPEARFGVLAALLVAAVGFVGLHRLLNRSVPLAGSPPVTAGMAEGPVSPGAGVGMDQIGDAFYRMLGDLRGATDRLEDLVFKLRTLNETVELAARVPKIQELLALVLQNTMRAVHATIGSIMILDPERQTLRLVASQGIPEETASHVEVRVGEGIAGKVIQFGEPVLVEDIESDPRFNRPSASRYGNGSFICMPIRAGERVIGVLNMAKRREAGNGPAPYPPPFSTIELQFLNTLMTYIGYSVENARLLEDARQSAQRLEHMVADLKASQQAAVRRETLRAIGQLSSGVAHHLNNLFAVILGRIELLLRKGQPADVRRALEIVLQTAYDGAEVVRRVQRFSRIEPLSEPVAVDMNQLVQDVVEITRARWYDEAQLRGVRIEVAVEPGVIPPAAGEPAPLREAVMNLLLNAIDAMPKGGSITIRTWLADGQVHCAVTDTGHGMSEEVRRHVLEPFFTTKGPKSLGLGLSAAYGTVQRYGGSLTIDSALGQGTTVLLRLLPANGEAPAAPRAAAAAPSPLRILVIDDDARVRATLADLLVAQGHTVVQATSGAEGIEVLAGGEGIDLVMTDLGMPAMTGWEVARIVRERWPTLRVGLITGWGEDDMPPEERARVDFVVSKPFDHASLHEALAGMLARRDAAGAA